MTQENVSENYYILFSLLKPKVMLFAQDYFPNLLKRVAQLLIKWPGMILFTGMLWISTHITPMAGYHCPNGYFKWRGKRKVEAHRLTYGNMD